MRQEKPAKKVGEKNRRKNFRKSDVDFGQYAVWYVV